MKLRAKNKIIRRIESYCPSKAEMMKEIDEEKNMRGAVLLVTISLSMPAFSHSGIRTSPPPIATHAPKTPAINPLNMPSLIF